MVNWYFMVILNSMHFLAWLLQKCKILHVQFSKILSHLSLYDLHNARVCAIKVPVEQELTGTWKHLYCLLPGQIGTTKTTSGCKSTSNGFSVDKNFVSLLLFILLWSYYSKQTWWVEHEIGEWIVDFTHKAIKLMQKQKILLFTVCGVCTNWYEFAPLNQKTALHVAHKLDAIWFCRYPQPEVKHTTMGKNFFDLNVRNYYTVMIFANNQQRIL